MEKQELTIIDPTEYGLEKTKAIEMTSGLNSIIEERNSLEVIYDELIIKELNQETLKEARELRLKVKNNRTKGIEVWHTTNKEFYLAGGRFVDAVKNKEIAANIRMEAKLDEIEKYFVNQEKERIANLKAERTTQLEPFGIDVEFVDLGNMSEEQFAKFYDTQKLAFDTKVENERLSEEKRLKEEEESKRVLELSQKRNEILKPYYSYLDIQETLNISLLNELEFEKLLEKAKLAKKTDEEKKAQQEKELSALRKQKEEADKIQKAKDELTAARTKELQPYIVFISDYNSLINLPAKEYKTQLEDIKKGAELQWESDRKEKLVQDALKAENEALLKQQQEAKEKEEKKLKAEIELSNADDKAKFKAWYIKFDEMRLSFPNLTSEAGLLMKARADEALLIVDGVLIQDAHTL